MGSPASSWDGTISPKRKRSHPLSNSEPRVEWTDQYEDCLMRCNNSLPAFLSGANKLGLSYDPSKTPHKLTTDEFTHKDVVLTIMAVWSGLGQIKYPYKIALAHESFYKLNGAPDPIGWVLPAIADSFILPLEMKEDPGEADNDARMVHVLVVCEPESADSAKLRVNIMSNAERQPEKAQIMDRVKYLISCSKWQLTPTSPPEVSTTWQWSVPKAKGGYDAHHSILNAWAYLLDIPINEDIDQNKLNGPFYREARHLFNLALRGRLDLETIELFLRESGYAHDLESGQVYQCIDKKYRQGLRKFRSVRINDTITPQHGALEIVSSQPSQRPLEGQQMADDRDRRVSEESGRLNSVGLERPRLKLRRYSDSPNNNWMEEYHTFRDIDIAGRAKIRQRKDITPYPDDTLSDEQVFIAIGSLWEPLWEGGVFFGFGSPISFQANRSASTAAELRTPALGGWKRFIMPLVITDDNLELAEQVESESNHWVLAVARLVNHASKTVQIDVYDSLDWSRDRHWATDFRYRVTEIAQNIVRYSGWVPNSDADYVPIAWSPNFEETAFKNCPVQTAQHCGHNTILNAWATLLELEICPANNCPPLDKEFYSEACLLFALAERGGLNGRTIQAFLNAYGYTKQQSLAPEKSVYKVRTTSNMTIERLQEDIKLGIGERQAELILV